MRLALSIASVVLAAACGPESPEGEALLDASAADAATDATATRPVPVASEQLCKLLSNRNTSDPTANDVQRRANVLGTDLGIPVVANDTLYLLFGDTIGYAGIWAPRESHPDSIAYGLDSATTLAAQPELLCTRMRFVTLAANQSIGPNVNASVQRDFAGVSMIAPPGQSLATYIHNPSGGNGGPTFPHLPGDFEVPSGAFTVGNAIYVFYTTVVGPQDIGMKQSYLARWTPSVSGPAAYQILYSVDQRFDANGPLGGRFINIAAEVHGEYVYLFGTGEFRKSAIHLARKRLDALATPGGFEELGVIVPTPGYGELSVRYFPTLDRWMLLAEELRPGSNKIVAYVADAPAGPWGEPIVLHDMGDASFRGKYCCVVEDNCQGEQMFNCSQTGFYGTYLFPSVIESGAQFTVTYTMSSFSPYNVALFQTTFQ